MAKAEKKITRMTGEQLKALRKALKINQQAFWKAVGTTQSGGSRYESGREMPEQVEALVRHVFLGQPLGLAMAAIVPGYAVPDTSKVLAESKDAASTHKQLRKSLGIK